EFLVVDVEKGARQPAFDHKKLAESLSKAAATEYKPDRLPFTDIEFTDEDRVLRFKAAGSTWKCDLTSYECTKVAAKTNASPAARPTPDVVIDEEPQAPEAGEEPVFFQQPGRRTDGPREARSPDGKWTGFIKENNVWVRGADGKETQLSQNGEAKN